MSPEKMSPPPEEGDLNTAAISKGLTAEEEALMRQDLAAVESGRMSSEPLAGTGDDMRRAEIADQARYDARREDKRFAEEYEFDQFDIFVRSRGVTKEQVTRDDLDNVINQGQYEDIVAMWQRDPKGYADEIKIWDLKKEFDALSPDMKRKINPFTGKIET